MLKKLTRNLLLLSLFAGAVALFPKGAQAQAPQDPHTLYIWALQDLRMARAYLNDGWAWEAVRQQDTQAVAEIDAAIHEIKAASYDDGRGINDHPPMEPNLGWHDRFQRAEDRLSRAQDNLRKVQDVNAAMQMRNRALSHVFNAKQIVDQAWRTARWQ